MPSLVHVYFSAHGSHWQTLILSSSELCSHVGVPGGGSQALINILSTHYSAYPPGIPQQDLTEEFTLF